MIRFGHRSNSCKVDHEAAATAFNKNRHYYNWTTSLFVMILAVIISYPFQPVNSEDEQVTEPILLKIESQLYKVENNEVKKVVNNDIKLKPNFVRRYSPFRFVWRNKRSVLFPFLLSCIVTNTHLKFTNYFKIMNKTIDYNYNDSTSEKPVQFFKSPNLIFELFPWIFLVVIVLMVALHLFLINRSRLDRLFDQISQKRKKARHPNKTKKTSNKKKATNTRPISVHSGNQTKSLTNNNHYEALPSGTSKKHHKKQPDEVSNSGQN